MSVSAKVASSRQYFWTSRVTVMELVNVTVVVRGGLFILASTTGVSMSLICALLAGSAPAVGMHPVEDHEHNRVAELLLGKANRRPLFGVPRNALSDAVARAGRLNSLAAFVWSER